MATKIENIKEIKLDFIIDYCQKHGEVEWLKEVASAPGLKDKNGKERKASFIEIRNAFVNKFDEFKALRPKPSSKKPSMYDRIMNL